MEMKRGKFICHCFNQSLMLFRLQWSYRIELSGDYALKAIRTPSKHQSTCRVFLKTEEALLSVNILLTQLYGPEEVRLFSKPVHHALKPQ